MSKKKPDFGKLSELLKSGALARTLGPAPKAKAEADSEKHLREMEKAIEEMSKRYYSVPSTSSTGWLGTVSGSISTTGGFATPSGVWKLYDESVYQEPAVPIVTEPSEPASAELIEKCAKLEAERDKALSAHRQLWSFIEEAGLLAEAVRWCDEHDAPVTT